MSNFEQSLKEHADDFKMMPSKKVWHGIYNNMHPGRRWPSVAMSLILLFTLVVVGYLNTNNSFHASKAYFDNGQLKNIKDNIINGTQEVLNLSKKDIENFIDPKQIANANALAASETFFNTSILIFVNPSPQNLNNKNSIVGSESFLDNSKDLSNVTPSSFPKTSTQPASLNNQLNSIDNSSLKINEQNSFQKNYSTSTNQDLQIDPTLSEEMLAENFESFELLKYENRNNYNPNNNVDFLQKKSITNIPLELKPLSSINKFHKKRNANINWMYYLSPVAGSVRFTGKEIKETPTTNFSPTVAINPRTNKVLHNSAFGLEAGTQMNVKLFSRLSFTTGFQLNYSGYKIISNEVHPAFATLILKDPNTGVDYSKSYVTHYGDGTGEAFVGLRNYSWQLSIPVGLQYRVYGNNKIQLNIAANIQPSLILKSKAYILSSDGGNYISDPSLMRRWNASSNFETFISFKLNKYTWHIGPNVRYQWLSTYQKDYTIKEHLIDYGVRIAISK